MTEDPRIALIREGFAAWEAGDVETTLALYDREIEVFAPPEIGNAGTYHGKEGFLEWAQAWLEAWDSFDQDLFSIEPVGETHAVARVMQRGVGKGSGIPVEREATYLYDIRGERLTYMALFFDHERALALAREREGAD